MPKKKYWENSRLALSGIETVSVRVLLNYSEKHLYLFSDEGQHKWNDSIKQQIKQAREIIKEKSKL